MKDNQDITAIVYIDKKGRARVHIKKCISDKMKLKNKQELKSEVLDGSLILTPIKKRKGKCQKE